MKRQTIFSAIICVATSPISFVEATIGAKTASNINMDHTKHSIVWNIGGKGLFDGTNKAYPIEDGKVTVNLCREDVLCPTGLGHLASGRTSVVKSISLLFEMKLSGYYWLHILWNPGGSGNEQFEISCNGISVGKSSLVHAKQKPNQQLAEKFKVKLKKGENNIRLQHLSGDGLHFKNIILHTSEKIGLFPPPLKLNLKYPTLRAYEAAIEEPGVMLDSTYVRLFAPKLRTKEAKTIFEYLVKAYEELYQLTGVYTEYKMVVYHFPQNHPDIFGGTSSCTIWYGYENLELEHDKEWKQYGVPHVCGYIEEMAHNFVHASGAHFGWEMIGWTISTKITTKVADNPIQKKRVQRARKEQMETFKRYIKSGYVFPKDLPGNQCDRIHAHILFLCEEKYGLNFWADFFQEIRKEHKRLMEAVKAGDADDIRNERYQITIDCFERLKGLNFKKMLQKYKISLTTDVKSLHPTESEWNRKFIW